MFSKIILSALFFMGCMIVGWLVTTGLVALIIYLFELAFDRSLDLNIWAIGGLVYVIWFIFFRE